MQTELTLPLAFLAGLAGAGHCWAMCGGLAGGLFLGRPPDYPLSPTPHLAYHAARILAYTLLGALAALLGQAIVLAGGVGRVQGLFYMAAGVLVMGVGAWRAGLLPRGWTAWLAGRWNVCQSGNHAVCLRHDTRTYGLSGFANGLMPCSLVFSLTLKAATAPDIATGATWLFAFGLGTVPAMALAALTAHWLGTRAQGWLHRGAGLVVLYLGLDALWAGTKFFHVMLHL
ncbi:MAG: sulfite exporter TauE/SafE family protein [Pseudomonadota bacterium]